jgi:hypothetical protein
LDDAGTGAARFDRQNGSKTQRLDDLAAGFQLCWHWREYVSVW